MIPKDTLAGQRRRRLTTAPAAMTSSAPPICHSVGLSAKTAAARREEIGKHHSETGERRHRRGAVERVGPGHGKLRSSAAQARTQKKEVTVGVRPPPLRQRQREGRSHQRQHTGKAECHRKPHSSSDRLIEKRS
jgi:hypothetical protein